MGYSGGTTENPTYDNLGDHTESIQIDYDPTVITYEQLLDVFWASHHPGVRAGSRQYLIAVFYHHEEQKRLAGESRDRVAEQLQGQICTEILPAKEFYLAEDYHQKYYLRLVPDLIKEFTLIYPNLRDLVDSTAAARANGYAAGYRNPAALQAELASLGLSPAGQKQLQSLMTAFLLESPSRSCPISKVDREVGRENRK